jgi:peptidyl-prolyl cis-trans isomerase A (cyclophilin A)
LAILLGAALLGQPAAAAPVPPSTARVQLDTARGAIVIELDLRRAPITAGNFLRYVDEKRFDGTDFYRAARAKSGAPTGLVQGGIGRRLQRSRLPIAHEPTSKTGLRHGDGTISMARNAPGTAAGNFFITLGRASSLDARGDYPGFAVFGRVVRGMDVVRGILLLPTFPGGFTATTKGQTLRQPVPILRARRVG